MHQTFDILNTFKHFKMKFFLYTGEATYSPRAISGSWGSVYSLEIGIIALNLAYETQIKALCGSRTRIVGHPWFIWSFLRRKSRQRFKNFLPYFCSHSVLNDWRCNTSKKDISIKIWAWNFGTYFEVENNTAEIISCCFLLNCPAMPTCMKTKIM